LDFLDASLALRPFQKGASGTVVLPGSKSITNRCLLLSALAEGESLLSRGLISEDADLMQKALADFGVQIEKNGERWIVQGTAGKFPPEKRNIYLGNAGTAVRFLTAMAGLAPGETRIHGKERMHQRPIFDLLSALGQIGVEVESENNNGCPPVIILGKGKIPGGKCTISGKTSSQFLSALFHIAPLTEKGIRIHITPPLVSRPYLNMTIALLEKFGVSVQEISEYEFFVPAQKIHPVTMEIEADASSAAHVFSIAIAAKGEIEIPNFPQNSIQGDAKFLNILKVFGAEIKTSEKGTVVRMEGEVLPLGEINMEDMPDVALATATLSALAKGRTKITGLSTLRKKECDRIEVIQKNLQRMGAEVKSGEDFLEIFGNPDLLHGAEIETHDDHRIAMSFAALGGRIPGVIIEDPKCVEKTFPQFWEVFESVRA